MGTVSSAPSPGSAVALRCRLIEDRDLDAVIGLLRTGFPERSEAYWRQGLARHLARGVPDGVPRFGYCLDHGGRAVGVLLTLYTQVVGPAGFHLRCNLSSWYVEPPFRAMAVMLDSHTMRDKAVTYLNVSAAPHTWAMQEARGFQRYCRGQVIALPALSRRRRGQSVEAFSEAIAAALPARERALARDHAAYGCVVLVCREGDAACAVVLQARRLNIVPGWTASPTARCFQLVFGPTAEELARWLGAIGRHLLRHHGTALLVLDANGPLRGAVGRYFEGRAPKYAKGPNPVPLGDLSYTEMVLFGP